MGSVPSTDVLHDVVCFCTARNGSTTSSMRIKLLTHWDLIRRLHAVTTDKANNVFLIMEEWLG